MKGWTLKTWSMVCGYSGGFLSLLAVSGSMGKYTAIIGATGAALTATGVHMASNTSAGHPDGSGTTLAQAGAAVKQEVAATIDSNASVAAEAARKP
jgi:hypothetical protein